MSGECETCGNHTLECVCEQAPERIGRYAYSEIDVHYAEPPAFISGATEYVRADLFDAMKAERDEQYRRADTLAQQNAYHKDRAEKAEAERDEARLDLAAERQSFNLLAEIREAERDEMLAFIKPFAEAEITFDKAGQRFSASSPDDAHITGLKVTRGDLRRARALIERIGCRDD